MSQQAARAKHPSGANTRSNRHKPRGQILLSNSTKRPSNLRPPKAPTRAAPSRAPRARAAHGTPVGASVPAKRDLGRRERRHLTMRWKRRLALGPFLSRRARVRVVPSGVLARGTARGPEPPAPLPPDPRPSPRKRGGPGAEIAGPPAASRTTVPVRLRGAGRPRRRRAHGVRGGVSSSRTLLW